MRFTWRSFLIWIATLAVMVGVLAHVVTQSLDAIKDVDASNHVVLCEQLAHLSHTPTPAVMRKAECPVSMLHDVAPVPTS